MKLAVIARLSEEGYLEGEKAAKVKHEYVAGEVFAMAGASKAHVTITINLAALLRTACRGKPCRTFAADMKVHAATSSAYYYPDVVVTCSSRDLAADSPAYYLKAPALIVEVLSESTERIDRREKLLAYQQIDSLEHYLLVDQDKVEVEHYHRTSAGWVRDILSSGDQLALPMLDLVLGVEQIYEDTGLL